MRRSKTQKIEEHSNGMPRNEHMVDIPLGGMEHRYEKEEHKETYYVRHKPRRRNIRIIKQT